MDTTQDWIAAYIELCAIVKTKVTEVTHADLWHQQIDYEDTEYPWPTNSVFFEFNTDDISVIGNGVQNMNAQITVYHAFNTLSDTYDESNNQAIALAFGNTIKKIHNALQATSGVNFSSLNRISLKRYPAPMYLICYAQTYTCIITDYSGSKQYDQSQSLNDIGATLEVDNSPPDAPPDLSLGYIVDM